MQNNTLLISSITLLIGFAAAYFVFEGPAVVDDASLPGVQINPLSVEPVISTSPSSENDAAVKTDQASSRLDALEAEIAQMKQQISGIEKLLQNSPGPALQDGDSPVRKPASRTYSALEQRLYRLDNLIKGGIDPTQAEEIVRMKNQIELKRLALEDRAKRNNFLNTQKYYDELEAINQEDTSLREILGDAQYDEYLFNSKLNNRIKIASVMLGSAAEQAGIQKNDVVLSYDNQRMFTWQELKSATTEGQLGDYVSISIYRNGEIYSFSVPRGPLGVQLGATRLQP